MDGHGTKIISVHLDAQEFSGFKDVVEMPVVNDAEIITVECITWDVDIGEMQVCLHWLLDPTPPLRG